MFYLMLAVSRGATFTADDAFLSPPPQLFHWNVIQNEFTVCFRTMQTPPSVQVGCFGVFIRLGKKIKKMYYVPLTFKTKVAPLKCCDAN